MNNPDVQLNSYLDKLSDEITVLSENLRSLRNIVEELNKDEDEEFKKCYWYLSRSLYDLLFDNLVLNLGWLFDKNGERSLIFFLSRLSEQSDAYFRSLAEREIDYEPSLFLSQQSIETDKEIKKHSSQNKSERKQKIKETQKSYRQKIEALLCELNSNPLDEKYLQLKHVRDNSVAHRDKLAFDDPIKFWENAKLTIEDIDFLANFAIRVIKEIYSIMRGSELVILPSAYVGIPHLFGRLKKYREMEKDYYRQKHRPWLLET